MLLSKSIKTRYFSSRYFSTKHYDVAIVGAGSAGLGAALRLKYEGMKVVVVESRKRAGGRTWTDSLGDHKVDFGASWIHGIGPGVNGIVDYAGRRSPTYEYVKKHNIKIVKTWDEESEAREVYYHHKNGKLSDGFMVFASRMIEASVRRKIARASDKENVEG